MKNIKFVIIMIIGLLIGYFGAVILKKDFVSISYMTKFELNDAWLPRVIIRGSYNSGARINSVNLDCNLELKKCNESSMFIMSKTGIVGLNYQTEYEIIENTPSKVIAETKDRNTTFSYIIDFDKRIVTFKRQSNINVNDINLYVLEDSESVIKKALESKG